jgi:methionyl-tRNA synthetase
MNAFQLTPNKRYLLISAKPAPNGGLHLGHIAGPYLRQDMLRRHYQMRGATVHVVGGTDPVDSFIALRATQDDAKPDRVAQRYYEQICRDFQSFDIHLDAFIDPLSNEWRDRYVACFRELVERASGDGDAREIEREFPFFAGETRGASGAWICGCCPDCGDGVSGYFCESCGAHFEPSEIITPALRGGSDSLAMRPASDLFFAVRDPAGLVASLEDMGVPKALRAIVERQFEKGRTTVRLTERSDWGIPVDANDPRLERRYFGHGLLYGYCRLLGDVYRNVSGDPVNPFDATSDVFSVNLFGIDNTVSHMVNIQAIGRETEGWKGFDAFVVNRFYLLEGRKFSTSARHLIWASDLIHTSGADSDAVRFTISATSPTWQERDLRIDEFLHWYNTVYGERIRDRVIADVEFLQGKLFTTPADAVLHAFEPLWVEVCQGHAFPEYAPEQQIGLIMRWMNVRENINQDDSQALCTWLRCLLLALYPVAPKLCSWTWNSLGLPDKPSVAAFQKPATVALAPGRPMAAVLTQEALFRAMPDAAVAHARSMQIAHVN